MHGNLPVPEGPRAPVNLRWFLHTAPPAGIIAAYRLIPAGKRSGWNNGVSTSHEAMAAVLAPGGGWAALARYATPQLATRKRHGFAAAWALLLLSAAIPGVRISQQQSWAN